MGCSNGKGKENSDMISKSKGGTSSKIEINKLKLEGILNKDNLSNHYKVLEKVGTGSFGKVYKVLHLGTRQERALKVINKANIKYQDDEQKFLKEIELLSQLDHPSIIRVYEYFEENANYYVAEEFCRGGELYEQIYKIDCFTEKDAATIMKQVFSAVYYLHSMNIIHRDLKPENIMLDNIDPHREITLKLIDFGTANIFTPGKYLEQKVGTSYYIAPEVVLKKYNQQADIWSCGVILFILLSGYPPFDGDTDEEIMDSVIKDEISYDDQEWENVSDGAKNFLKKLLVKNPNKRLTAEQALKDEWLNKTCSLDSDNVNMKNLSSQISNFQKFDSRFKLKNAILRFLVHNVATEEMTKDLRDAFKKFDTSGDGRLSLDELKEGFKEVMKKNNRSDLITEEEIIRRFQSIDIDKSNFIEIEEFIAVTINEELLMNEQNLRMTFDYFDKDKSGTLDQEEILGLLQNRGSEEDKNMCMELIKKYDDNNDGVLSFEEFKRLLLEYNKP